MSRGSSLGGEGQSDYFNSVTGTSDYERQSWRDSYNDGRAAGDLTGATNARLEAERDAFQGATWSGSSTEYSALELAQLRGAAPGAAQAAVVGNQAGPTEAGVPAVTPANTARIGNAKGHSIASVLSGAGLFGTALAYKPMDLALSGFDMRADPTVSNAEDVETRHGEVAAMLYGVYSVTADVAHNTARMYFGDDYRTQPLEQRVNRVANDGAAGVLGAFFGGLDAVDRWGANNAAQERAATEAAKEVDAAWGYREMLQQQEAHKAGDAPAIGGMF